MATKSDSTSGDPFERLAGAGEKADLLRAQLRVIGSIAQEIASGTRVLDEDGAQTLFSLNEVALLVLERTDDDLRQAEERLYAAGMPEALRAGMVGIAGRA